MDIQIKKDGGHYLEIYHPEFKILEKENNELWNATEEQPIAVDKIRFNNGDYVLSDERVESHIVVDEMADENQEYYEDD